MTLLYLSICTKHKLSTVDKGIKRTKEKVVVLPENLLMMDLLFLHSTRCFISVKVIFQRDGKKGSKNNRNIPRI